MLDNQQFQTYGGPRVGRLAYFSILYEMNNNEERILLELENTGITKLDINRIHFSFLDGSHDYEDVKFEFEFVNKKNKSGDIIILDDYTPNFFDGIVKLTNEIKEKNVYEVNIINNNEKRGYVILKKK